MVWHAAAGAVDLDQLRLLKGSTAVRACRGIGHLLPLPLAEMKCVPADLNQVAALQRAIFGRLARNKDRTFRMKKSLRAPQFNAAVSGLYGWVFEQVDIRLLIAANHGQRFVKDELFTCQRSSRDVQPSILQRALHDTHGHACGQTEQSESYGTAGSASVCPQGNGIKDHAAQASADDAAKDSVAYFFAGSVDQAINNTACHTEHHPCHAASNPEGRIPGGVHSQFCNDSHGDHENQVSDLIKNDSADEAQHKRKQPAPQSLVEGAFHNAFRDAESKAH